MGPHVTERSHQARGRRLIRELTARWYYLLSLALGWLLRSATYSTARVDVTQVRKRRRGYAPLLVWLGGPLMKMLGTGVRVLGQREWEEREQLIYSSIYGAKVLIDGGILVLPRLPGESLASLLENQAVRKQAIELAARALAAFHDCGFTHGDAMAENVLVDVESGTAHWFDFENVHDESRPMEWRRADDVRALLTTCVLRTEPAQLAETVQLIMNAYATGASTRGVPTFVAAHFASVWQRPLAFHLGQAALAYGVFREIESVLSERLAA